MTIQPVILSGGSGTRLWPRSRANKPKPFLALIGQTSLFEQTLDRCKDANTYDPPLIVTGQQYLSYVREQAGDAEVILEPVARNTAPAIGLAAMRLPRDKVMLVCPSDHFIRDEQAFHAAVEAALPLAEQGHLVTFGIAPDRPETGYGYIERGDPLGAGYKVARFVEKPDAQTAVQLLSDGRYSWNGGLFLFTAGAFLDQLALYRPDMRSQLEKAVQGGVEEGTQFHPDVIAFDTIEGESIDYALMENTQKAAIVEVNMGWSDIGSWASLHSARPADKHGNRVSGPAELVDCSNVLIDSDGPRVSAIGLEDLVIVVDGDEVLVSSAEKSQLVGKLKGASKQ